MTPIHTAAAQVDQFFATRADDLVLAMELEDARPSQTASRLIYALAALVVLGLLWACVTPVEEVARVRGAIAPAGDVIAIQHLEGGQVAEILVDDGDIVQAGDPLVRLSAASAQARIEQLVSRRDALRLSIARERAMDAGGALAEDGVHAGIAEEQSALLAAQRASTTAQRSVLDAQVVEMEARIDTLSRQIEQARDVAATAAEERRFQEDYFSRGVTTRDRLVRARDADASASRALIALESEHRVTREQLGVTLLRRAEFDAVSRTALLTSTADLVAELAEVEASLREAEDRVARLNITAPVDGVVTDLSVSAVNSVIGPGAPVLQIVPINDRLIVEAQVAPRDITRVALGQPVAVRVDSFDFATFGVLDGQVERISPTTFPTEDGGAVYRVRVGLDRAYFGEADAGLVVSPGMTVEADIKAGDRSLMSYFLRPITRGWDRSFNEP